MHLRACVHPSTLKPRPGFPIKGSLRGEWEAKKYRKSPKLQPTRGQRRMAQRRSSGMFLDAGSWKEEQGRDAGSWEREREGGEAEARSDGGKGGGFRREMRWRWGETGELGEGEGWIWKGNDMLEGEKRVDWKEGNRWIWVRKQELRL